MGEPVKTGTAPQNFQATVIITKDLKPRVGSRSVRDSSRKVEAGEIVQRVDSSIQGLDMILYTIESLGRVALKWFSQKQTQEG